MVTSEILGEMAFGESFGSVKNGKLGAEVSCDKDTKENHTCFVNSSDYKHPAENRNS